MRSGSLVAQPFDSGRMQFTGEPIPIAPRDVQKLKRFFWAVISQFLKGARSICPARHHYSRFEWFDRSGKELGPIGVSGAYEPRLSPDGRYVAYSNDPAFDGNRSVWTFDLLRKTATRLTDGDRDGFPVWSPDGKQFLYGGSRGDGFSLYVRATNGSGNEQLLTKGIFLPPTDWSHDGQTILYMNVSHGLPRLYSRSVNSSGTVRE